MSRRGQLTQRQAQFRAASRMTVGTRMWSEQPVESLQPRMWTPAIAQQGSVPIPPPPTSMRYVDISTGLPSSHTLAMSAGESAILFTSSDANQLINPDPSWRRLLSGTWGSGWGMNWHILSRTALVNETVTIATAPGGAVGPWTLFNTRGYVFNGPIAYDFIPVLINRTISPTVTMQAWGGKASAYRMRAVVTRGCYAGWIPGQDGGLSHYNLGYIDARTSFWSGPASTPLEYLRGNFIGGTGVHNSIGAAGTPSWAEYHIEVVAAP